MASISVPQPAQPVGLFPSIQQNLIDPVTQGLFGPPPPRTSASGTPLPPAVAIDNFVTQVNQSPFLSLERRDSIIQQVLHTPELLGQLQNQFAAEEQQRRDSDAADQQRAQQLETQRIALGDLSGLETRGNEFFQTQTNRFVDPTTGGIRSDLLSTDPTFANAISSADAGINANINRVRTNAALSQAGTGSNASGKGATAVGNAENTAAGQRGANRSTLFQRANDFVFDPNSGLQRQGLDFQAGVNDARTNINSGLAPNLTGLSQFGAPNFDFSLPYQQQFGEAQAGFGRNLSAFGALTDLAGAATDSSINAASLFTNSFKGN